MGGGATLSLSKTTESKLAGLSTTTLLWGAGAFFPLRPVLFSMKEIISVSVRPPSYLTKNFVNNVHVVDDLGWGEKSYTYFSEESTPPFGKNFKVGKLNKLFKLAIVCFFWGGALYPFTSKRLPREGWAEASTLAIMTLSFWLAKASATSSYAGAIFLQCPHLKNDVIDEDHYNIDRLTLTRPSKQHSNRLTKGHRIWRTQALIHQLSGQNHRVWALLHCLQLLRMQQEEARQRTTARKRPSSSLVEGMDRFESRSQLALSRDHRRAGNRNHQTWVSLVGRLI